MPTVNEGDDIIDYGYTALLGLLQGITEFLPVSSSGHLVIAQHLFGMRDASLFLDTILHLGTLAAVVAVFWSDLKELCAAVPLLWRWGPRRAWREHGNFRLLVWLAVGTLPAAVVGLVLADFFEAAFGSVRAVGAALFFTALVLFTAAWKRQRATPLFETRGWQALGVGLAQALAIMPGISRSGMTIVVGQHLGLARDAAARLSFLLAIPAILGAVLLQAIKLESVPAGFAPAAIVGFVTAAVSGYLSLRLLLRFVQKGRLHFFGVYCLLAGSFALFVGL
ncbi:MAG: undecaprenyl-diphosphate phosphatase [Candidatus Lernaella stagnicola]|nr:undecaprenyl-diphosphate phosphatase [Candidatus Lernaella stagnicola]